MDNLQKESSDIFLTSPIIINSNSRNFLENNKRRNLLFSKNYLSPIKHQLIQKNIFHNSILEEKKTEKVPLLNSYFTPENFKK